MRRVVCFAPRAGNKAPFVLVEEWLGHTIPAVDPEDARAELLRRYLRCYGPSTRGDFAAWLGIKAGDAYHREVWKTLGEPGAVLVNGAITGVWRPRESGRKVTITIKTFGSLPAQATRPLQDEAEQLAPLRGTSSVAVEFDTY